MIRYSASSILDDRFAPIIASSIIASSIDEGVRLTDLAESPNQTISQEIFRYYSDDINCMGWTKIEVKSQPPHDLDHYRIKNKLKDLLQKFTKVPFFQDSDQCANEEVAKKANKFLNQISEKMLLPKIAVDEDGDIIFAWEIESRSVILTIEEESWHFFEKTQSKPPFRLDEKPYENDQVSDLVWNKIPTK